ncbi:MAG: RecQ family ATP-dependent DNA helicase, partial [Chitinophagaceae bacterium]
PQNDAPQIVFRKNRVAAADLRINLVRYNERKDSFVQRVKTMVAYLQATTCRSRFISHYFGDKAAVACGVCDNCLGKKQQQLSADEFTIIAKAIQQQLAINHLTAEQLLVALPSIKKEKAWQVLQFLQAEKKILVSTEGLLHTTS